MLFCAIALEQCQGPVASLVPNNPRKNLAQLSNLVIIIKCESRFKSNKLSTQHHHFRFRVRTPGASSVLGGAPRLVLRGRGELLLKQTCAKPGKCSGLEIGIGHQKEGGVRTFLVCLSRLKWGSPQNRHKIREVSCGVPFNQAFKNCPRENTHPFWRMLLWET